MTIVDREATIPGAAARRLSNQLDRAFRGTYGADAGLQTLLRSIARQMLHAGGSPDGIIEAFERCVVNHPAIVEGASESIHVRERHSKMLMTLTRQCVADAVLADAASAAIGGL